ncbi:nucleotidyltransferase family protein [Candidatus Sumerlaeota bacterium]|nr:nucleotidyltransferase family protein [Candidatus Sumerlaeota bacterium]
MQIQNLDIPEQQIEEYCRQKRIRKMMLFGSVVRNDFRPESDVDVLVEFEPEARVGLIRFAGMELELTDLLKRKVDLNTIDFIHPEYRDEILREARLIYDQAQ